MKLNYYIILMLVCLCTSCATTPVDAMFYGTWQSKGTKGILGNMSLYSDHTLEYISYNSVSNAIRSTFVGTWKVEEGNLIITLKSSVGDPDEPEAWHLNPEPVIVPIISVTRDTITLEAKVGGVQKLVRKE